MMRCPKCGNEQADTVVCAGCGIYFAKYQAAQGRKVAASRVGSHARAVMQAPAAPRRWMPTALAAAGILAIVGLLWAPMGERHPETGTTGSARQGANRPQIDGSPSPAKPASGVAVGTRPGDYSDPLLRGADARVISAYHDIRQSTEWQPEQGVSDAELAHIRVRAYGTPVRHLPPDDQLDQAIADTERDLEVVRSQMKQILEGPIKQTKYFTPRYGARDSVERALEGWLAVLMDRKRVVSPTAEMIAKDKQAIQIHESTLRAQEWNRQQQRNNDLQNQYRSDPRNRLGHSHYPN
jgi:hypothetical protein